MEDPEGGKEKVGIGRAAGAMKGADDHPLFGSKGSGVDTGAGATGRGLAGVGEGFTGVGMAVKVLLTGL